MSPPHFSLPRPYSPLCSCEDCTSTVINASSKSPSSNLSSTEIAYDTCTPHTLDPIVELHDHSSLDSDSGDEATNKLKALIERQVGTAKAGNRDTIDSILSKYNYEPEIGWSSSKSSNDNRPNQNSTNTALGDLKRVLEPNLTPKVAPTRVDQREQLQVLQCPHCDDSFHFSYSGNTLRATGLGQDETVPNILKSIAARTNNTSGCSDPIQSFDSSDFVTEDTTLSTFDHGTAPPSETGMNESSGYSLHNFKDHINKAGDYPPTDTPTQRDGSSRDSMGGSDVSTPHTPRHEDRGIGDILEGHWAFLKNNLAPRGLPQNDIEIEFGNEEDEVSEKDSKRIGMLLRNLEDVQKQMDDLLAKHPLPPSRPKNDCGSPRIPADRHNKGSAEPVHCKQRHVEDIAPTKKEVKEVVDSVESTKGKTKDKARKRAVTSFMEMLDGSLGAEIFLAGAMCTMYGLVFASGASST